MSSIYNLRLISAISCTSVALFVSVFALTSPGLAKHPKNYERLMATVYEGSAENIPYLKNELALGLDPNYELPKGPMLVSLFDTSGSLDIAKILLKYGANIDVRDGGGMTPLFVAASWGYNLGVKFLLEHGADPSLKTKNGLNAISFVNMANKGSAELFIILMSAGVDPCAPREQTSQPAAKFALPYLSQEKSSELKRRCGL